jgi:hypothetical protein
LPVVVTLTLSKSSRRSKRWGNILVWRGRINIERRSRKWPSHLLPLGKIRTCVSTLWINELDCREIYPCFPKR